MTDSKQLCTINEHNTKEITVKWRDYEEKTYYTENLEQ